MTKIQERVARIKEKIRLAIISKGVEVPENTTLLDMAEKICEIKVSKSSRRAAGGNQMKGENDV
jgi:hypothetical protein